MKKNIYTLLFFSLVTQIGFGQWVQIGLGDKSINDIAARNSNIFVITSDSGSVYRSTNNGINWTVIVDTGSVDIAISPSGTVFMLKKFQLYGNFPNRLFSSSDNGATWDTLTVLEQIVPQPWSRIPVLLNVSVNHNGFVYCGIQMDSYTFIALSTDGGITWTTPGQNITGGHLFDYKNECVISTGYDILSGRLFLSTDNGYSWTWLGNPPLYSGHILSLCLNGNIFIGGADYYSSGLFITTDSCATWLQVSTVTPQAGLSIESGGTLVSTDSLGVFIFSDNGDSLGSRNDGLTNLNIHTLTIDNNDYVYAGTDNGVWRRPLSEITSVEEDLIDEVPTKFLLSQNYPNPFNPSSKIKYQVSSISHVSLVVYDVLGNEIETLVNEEKPAGTYELSWNAVGLSSGIYFYQLKAGPFIGTKKMILMK